MSTRSTFPSRKSSVISRARGMTSANTGRSPNPAKWASIGTPARGIASRPLRPTARAPCDQPLALLALGEKRVILGAEDRREVCEDLIDDVAVRPRRERRVLGT